MAKKRKAVKRKNPPSKRKQRKMVARVRWADTPAKKNPAPKLKKLNKSTGWIPASAVKIVKNRGKIQVLYRKRPARRKTARRR